MSKIFEALRKVQAEVSKRADDAGQAKEVRAAPTSKSQEHNAYVDLGVPESFVAEMVSMRYSLESKVSRERRALVFTCSVRGEGVSTVSRLYSQILVKDPVSKAVLVDSNTHHPSVHTAFGLEMGPGLTDLLAGRNKLEECLYPTDSPRLQVMPVGNSMIAPMQAFASEALKKMIAEALATNNYLIFDAPPVLLYPEATILGGQVDGVVYIVQAVRTKKEVIHKAVEAVGKGGGEVLGLVLNKNKHFIPEFIYKRV